MRTGSRRRFLLSVGLSTLAHAAETLEVAYAGSMASVMEGPIKAAVSKDLGLTLQGRAQGSNGLAQLIVSGSIRPDVFIAVTPSPMDAVVKAGKAVFATVVARTEMVIAYNPSGRFGAAKTDPWWKRLEQPDFRFGRTDPGTDPQGRNIIFVMQLAEELYHQPGLARKILGPDVNPQQIFAEPSVEARLQSGQLDAASAYKVQPAGLRMPYFTLPKEINLSDERMAAAYSKANLTLNGKSYRPEPLIYTAAVLKTARNQQGAAQFLAWLAGPDGQIILKRNGYDAP